MIEVLVIDDDELTAAVLKKILETRDYHVHVAHDGESGVELARKIGPALILLDINMPKMTGLEALPLLRSHPAMKETRIIALTASTSTENRDEAHLAGCDRYITKPIDMNKVFGAIDELLG